MLKVTDRQLSALSKAINEGYRQNPDISITELAILSELLTNLESYQRKDSSSDFNAGILAARDKLLDISLTTEDQGIVLVLRALADVLDSLKQ